MLYILIPYISAVEFYPYLNNIEAYDPTFDRLKKGDDSSKEEDFSTDDKTYDEKTYDKTYDDKTYDDKMYDKIYDDSLSESSETKEHLTKIKNYNQSNKSLFSKSQSNKSQSNKSSQYNNNSLFNTDQLFTKLLKDMPLTKPPIRSYTQGKINTSQENLNKILKRELNDVSADLSHKVEQAIGNVSKETPNNFKEVIIIKKRILSDGKRKVVNLNVRERLVPKEKDYVRDFGVRALIGGGLFLVAGVLFTTSVKVYQGWVRKRYIRLSEKGDKMGEKY